MANLHQLTVQAFRDLVRLSRTNPLEAEAQASVVEGGVDTVRKVLAHWHTNTRRIQVGDMVEVFVPSQLEGVVEDDYDFMDAIERAAILRDEGIFIVKAYKDGVFTLSNSRKELELPWWCVTSSSQLFDRLPHPLELLLPPEQAKVKP